MNLALKIRIWFIIKICFFSGPIREKADIDVETFFT